MKKISEFRRSIMMAQGGVLPYDAEVEYLQSDGNQWIELPIKPSEVTDAIEMTVKVANVASKHLCICENSRIFNAYVNGNKRVGYYYNGSYSGNNGYQYIGGYYSVIKYDPKNKKVYSNGYSISISGTSTLVSDENLRIFGGRTDVGFPTGRLYSVKYWRNDVLIMDLIPVRKSGVGYMYDKIGGTLYGNRGTGTFTIGYDKLTSLSDYTQIDYLKNTAKAFINTMYFANGDTSILCKFKNDESSVASNMWPYILGSLISKRYAFYIANTRYFTAYHGSTYKESTTYYDTQVHELSYNTDGFIFDEDEFQYQQETFQLNLPLWLFSANQTNNNEYANNYRFFGKIYYLKIMENGVLKRDFVPVLHPAGIYGMFDKVENKFYESAWNNAFTGGYDN